MNMKPEYARRPEARRIGTQVDAAAQDVGVWDYVLMERGIVVNYQKIPSACYSPARAPTYVRYFWEKNILSEAESTRENRARLQHVQHILAKLQRKVAAQPDERSSNFMEFFAEQAELGGDRMADATRPIYRRIDAMMEARGTAREHISKGIGFAVKFGVGWLAAKATGVVVDSDLLEWAGGFAGFGLSHLGVEKASEWWEERQMNRLSGEKFRIYAETAVAVAVGMQQWIPEGVNIRPSMDTVHDEVKRYMSERTRTG